MKEFSRENIRQQIEKLLPVMRGLVLNVRDAVIEDRVSLKTRKGNNFETFIQENNLSGKAEGLMPSTFDVEFTPEDIAVSLVEGAPLYPEYKEFTETFKTRDRLLTTISDYKRICYKELNRAVGVDEMIISQHHIFEVLVNMILESSYYDFPGSQNPIISEEGENGEVISIYLDGRYTVENIEEEDLVSDYVMIDIISEFIYNRISHQQ